jgi:hypothetical protein
MKKEYGFIADLFTNEYQGGAELTTLALMESCPTPNSVWAAKCTEITEDSLQKLVNEENVKNMKTHFVFGNFATLNPNMIPFIITNWEYSVIEYDYKFCEFRSMEKHEASVGKPCDCNEQIRGKIISQFYQKAKNVFFMSEKQRDVYKAQFPEWDMSNTCILSSVFTKSEWRMIEDARTLQRGVHRKDMWAFFDSDSWIKGAMDSEEACWNKAPKHGVVGFKDFDKMSLLNLFSEMSGFAFHPAGGDTCPRIVVEAKLMDCPLDINENVQMRDESWFKDGTYATIKEYLQGRPAVFWDHVGG